MERRQSSAGKQTVCGIARWTLCSSTAGSARMKRESTGTHLGVHYFQSCASSAQERLPTKPLVCPSLMVAIPTPHSCSSPSTASPGVSLLSPPLIPSFSDVGIAESPHGSGGGVVGHASTSTRLFGRPAGACSRLLLEGHSRAMRQGVPKGHGQQLPPQHLSSNAVLVGRSSHELPRSRSLLPSLSVILHVHCTVTHH